LNEKQHVLVEFAARKRRIFIAILERSVDFYPSVPKHVSLFRLNMHEKYAACAQILALINEGDDIAEVIDHVGNIARRAGFLPMIGDYGYHSSYGSLYLLPIDKERIKIYFKELFENCAGEDIHKLVDDAVDVYNPATIRFNEDSISFHFPTKVISVKVDCDDFLMDHGNITYTFENRGNLRYLIKFHK
jgi:hypothetical protein